MVKRDGPFRGPSLGFDLRHFHGVYWLNVNSTAIITGAILISPLMEPIAAAGLSVAINDLIF